MDNMDVIIFSGQSNMQGESEALLSSDAVAGAYEYKLLTNSIVPLKDPVGEDIGFDLTQGWEYSTNTDGWHAFHALGSSSEGNSSLLTSFCDTYVKKTGREVLAIHAARGSTTIDQWMSDTPGYRVLVKKVTEGIKKASELGEIGRVFLVWLQGESDAIFKKNKETYKKMASELNRSFKNDLGIEKFCIIRVGRFTNDSRDDEIIEAQSEICREDPDFLMLTEISTELNRQPEHMNPNVAGHYSAKGLYKLGYEAGKTLAEYVVSHG
jgi:hypothetical protein